MSIYDKYIDLHIHSLASDGTWSPKEIINIAKNNGVGILSITDHDEVNSIIEGRELAKENGLNYIKGIEVSSSLNDEWFHILAYGVDTEDKELNTLLEENRYKLEHKDDFTVQYLEKEGYEVSFKEYMEYQNDKKRGGWKALNYLIDKGICTDVNDYFQRLFKEKLAVQFPVYRKPEEVVSIIKKAGGVPIMAHPYYSSSIKEAVDDRLKRLLEFGVEGFECFHPNHSASISKECAEWCHKNNLIMTVGSDSHGEFIQTRRIGMHSIKLGDIELGRLKDYIL